MKIERIRVMRGPNYWSNYRKNLVVMTLDLEELEDYPTNTLDGFSEKLESIMPTLYKHRCSEGKPGGFFERLRKGTWMGHVIEHIALELQTLAGMPCGFGRTRSTNRKGVYHVVFAYQLDTAGVFAAKAAVRLAAALASDMEYDVSADIQQLSSLFKRQGLGPSTQALVNEARKRDIPYRRLNNESLIMLGHGKYQKVVCATMACTTSGVGVQMVSDKEQTKRVLEEGFLPVPSGKVIQVKEQLPAAIKEVGYPLVIKPVNGNHGRGVKVNIRQESEALIAFDEARRISGEVIVEKYIDGQDYRFLVIDYKLHAIARRTPAAVVGDNRSTIKELIDDTNRDTRRGEGHEKVLTTIKVDEVTHSILVEKNLTLNSVLPLGEILFLKDAANLSAGGTASDVTDIVHPHNVFLAERVARLMGMDICGIDVIAKDITAPITKENGAILEVNAGPGLRMHLAPARGQSRNVAEPIIRMLFPPGSPSRIPIIAVTGTNGKTTTTRLTAEFAKNSDYTVGYATTDGIYIHDQMIYAGDCAGPTAAEAVLRDPIVDFAVFECARGGILRSGLGFDKCDISIITNVTADHIGLDEIDSLAEMVKVKAVVAHSTKPGGYAILNADDDNVYPLVKVLDCNIALFSIHEDNARVREHCEAGGWAAVIEKGYFTVCQGEWKMRIGKVTEVPLTLEGKAGCMIRNILPSILAAALSDIDIRVIRKTLETFTPGPETTPGRMNIFRFPHFQLMLDYAHNSDGYAQLETFMAKVTASSKIGVITSPGDRRDDDIREAGSYAARIFDKVIIRHDGDCRGRKPEEITRLIREGIERTGKNTQVEVVSDELESIAHAIQGAPDGSFVVVCTEKVQDAIAYIQQSLRQQKGPQPEEWRTWSSG